MGRNGERQFLFCNPDRRIPSVDRDADYDVSEARPQEMNIAIIDADIVGKRKHRFPNLCCMKLSAYHKSIGDSVLLKTDYDNLDVYDKVYISKVFTDTEVPGEPKDKSNKNCDTIAEWYADNWFLNQPNIEYGGTGFFYDKAPPLPEHIEHIMPDYHLYDEWVLAAIDRGRKGIISNTIWIIPLVILQGVVSEVAITV